MALRLGKLGKHGAPLPQCFSSILQFYDSISHEHKMPCFHSEILNNLVSKVTTILETPSNFLISFLISYSKMLLFIQMILFLIWSASQITKTLKKKFTKTKLFFHWTIEVVISKKATLPTENSPLFQKLLNSWNVSEIVEQLKYMDFKEFITLGNFLPSIKNHIWNFMKKVKDIMLPIKNSVF